MKLAVVGAGGVGGYFGARLAQAGGDVAFLARGAHLSALRARGLRVRSVFGDFEVRAPATDDPAEIGACDAVLFCVKSYDTDSAALLLSPLLRDGTAVVSLQNGIDNEAKLAAVVGDAHVLGGVAYIFAEVVEPGVIEHRGGPSTIAFGELDGRVTERARRLLELCRAAGIADSLETDVRATLWWKYAFICAHAGLTAAARLPIGDLRADPETRAMFVRIATEIGALAAAHGVALGDDLGERMLAVVDSLAPGSFSSLHDDLVAGRRIELEALHGTAVRLGRERGVPVPACEAVYALLRPWASRLNA